MDTLGISELLEEAEESRKQAEKRIKWTKLKESKETTGWQNIFSKKYVLPNGKIKDFDIVQHHDSACILPITTEGEVVLVRQFRPGPEKFTLELPGGRIDPGEDPDVGAARELLEETGFSGEIVCVGNRMVGAYSTGREHMYLATNCKWKQEQYEDEDEFIEVVMSSLDNFRNWLKHCDMASLCGAYRALDYYDTILLDQ